jgi:glycine/D-amino acid oxidase-like deaminating enzyme
VSRADPILVVGAGVFGLTAALELRRRGHEVTLLDPGPLPHPAAASTDISKLVRMDYGTDELYTALMEAAFDGWAAWNLRWAETLYHEDGLLVLSRSEMRPGGFEHDSFSLLQRRGHPLRRLDSQALRERHPAWAAERYPDGYFNPKGGWAESAKVVARILDKARRDGVRLREGARFHRLLERRSRVEGIVTADGEPLRSGLVILATGAWTPTLVPDLSPVMWAVAQPVFHLRVPDPEAYRQPRFPPWAADIANTGWYGFPALADGTLKLACHGPGRRLHPDDPREVASEDEARLREFLRDTFPGLADAPLIASRLCFYCDSWDGDFWIDRDPDRSGLVVAAGDSGHAFKFAPVLGTLIADVAEGKPNPYASRFAWRSRGPLRTEQARCGADPS